jgi:hypothetical protein
LITGELKNSITTQPGSGVADATYTGLSSIDDNSYASGAVFSVTLASGSATALTASTVGQNYVEGDIITVSKSQFGTSACEPNIFGGRETDNSKCTAAASTWTDASCSITSGGRGDSETHCEAAASTWNAATCSIDTGSLGVNGRQHSESCVSGRTNRPLRPVPRLAVLVLGMHHTIVISKLKQNVNWPQRREDTVR